jgi:homocysteine S-methyltransferase
VLSPFLDDRGVVILDGALATELERRGADLDDPLWSARVLLEAPETIEAVPHDYFVAGADVATSASYQATFEGFAERGLGEADAERLLVLSVELAKRARDRFWEGPARRKGRSRPLVAASVGCYGAYLHDGSEYRGDYGLTKKELVDFHRRRLDVLARSGADLIACETIPCRVEAEALIELLRRYPDRPAWISFSCRSETEVSRGELFAECLRVAFSSEQVVAAGLNCTSPALVSGLLSSAKGVSDRPLVAYPNSGESWDAARRCWLPGGETAPLESRAKEWCDLGARLIGGCCRTTPETIRALSRALGHPSRL